MSSNAFAKMKKRRSNVADLTSKLEEAGGKKKDFGDDRMWYPAVEKSGNGYAVIRFLPPSVDNDVPFVKVFSHGFQGAGGWYIDECPTTVDQECPVCKMNQALVHLTVIGMLLQKRIKLLYAIVSVEKVMYPIFWLLKILKIQKMKVRYSYSNMVRRFLIN